MSAKTTVLAHSISSSEMAETLSAPDVWKPVCPMLLCCKPATTTSVFVYFIFFLISKERINCQHCLPLALDLSILAIELALKLVSASLESSWGYSVVIFYFSIIIFLTSGPCFLCPCAQVYNDSLTLQVSGACILCSNVKRHWHFTWSGSVKEHFPLLSSMLLLCQLYLFRFGAWAVGVKSSLPGRHQYLCDSTFLLLLIVLVVLGAGKLRRFLSFKVFHP